MWYATEMKKTELAWFAGFFEGEGSVRLSTCLRKSNGRRYGAPVLDIVQVNKEPLIRALSIFPEGKIYGPYDRNKKNKSPYFRFVVNGKDRVEAVFNAIKSHLSTRRTNQFAVTFADYITLMDRPRLVSGRKAKVVNV